MSIQVRSLEGTSQAIFQHKFFRCVGPIRFRSQLARDVSCLLDFDDTASAWACQSLEFRRGFDTHRPDFVIERDHDILVVDVASKGAPPSWIAEAVRAGNYSYQVWSRGEIDPIRLKNCKDLLRYSGPDARLGDRIRLLSALEDQGTLTLSECLQLLQESQPIVALANMILARFIQIDLDTALLGPETSVRKFSR
ncbi:hypothetical protein [Agrobacterium sp. Azo12]|uniref:hypothetical protein n=1 Tax=Agrobacterium sp. Azo12 TaxID=3031129 RepID=UPI0023D7DFAB|nr:hypothetical protein [Agrobacterium sp. Azo12]MDO5897868.1 hypothetical protein [Agrobacterium sp. Azo12]